MSLRFGVIGCGLMGREFAGASARWLHLKDDILRPEIVAVSDVNEQAMDWFLNRVPTVEFHTTDYKKLLARTDVDAVYCAVPHALHEKIYIDCIRAGKHLMGEKPFGIDAQANANILAELEAHPQVFCRCSSEFPFYPAMRVMEKWIEERKYGKLLDVKSGFLHSSDMDESKPINWKRRVEFNGEYGCMGDLGMHAQHILIRYGLLPKSVSAILSNVVKTRPDGQGGRAECTTFDNATLMCRADGGGYDFPILIETKRLSPGSTNEWYLRINGTKGSAYFTTDDAGAFHWLDADGQEQAWTRINVGSKPQFAVNTGGIFEFGFTDAILQMWAAFMTEFEGSEVEFGCVRPQETAVSHAMLTAALKSNKTKREVPV